MSDRREELIVGHASTLQLKQVSCEQLCTRGVDFSHYLGYHPVGIVKGSEAAQLMSKEMQLGGGILHKVTDGGISASFQSIGSTSQIKQKPCENIRRALVRQGMLREDRYLMENAAQEPILDFSLPSYFIGGFDDRPQLYDDYRVGGYNCLMAERMLNGSIRSTCRIIDTRCKFGMSSKFTVNKFERLENINAFARYKRHEARVACALDRDGLTRNIDRTLPSWLKKLSEKNGLSTSANTVYLLHGIKTKNLEEIIQEGLKTKFSLSRASSYGKGLYFTDSSCKASQYATNGCILVCRVVLGRMETLSGQCSEKKFPARGYDSARAKRGVTLAPHGHSQLHNEYIIYNESACYPEFIIYFDKTQK